MLIGRRVASRVRRSYARAMLDPLATPPARLSKRETQVLDLVSSGLTNLEVAARLDIGVHAVKFHLASIYRKLGVGNRTEATSIYLRTAAGVLREAREAEGSG
jgi:DNA-binding CsgD family transcriptional regulator